MKLYIRAKRFSLRDGLIVRNEKDEPIYEIKSEWLSFGRKVHIYDQNKEEVASIEEKKLGFSPKYAINQLETNVAVVKKEKNLMTSDYDIDKLNWRIRGNVEDNDYKIKEKLRTVAELKKKWFSVGESYVLEVEEEQDSIVALAIVVAIWSLQADTEEKEDR
ncbi:LURP-one-related family protein [Desemzia sp. RIT804]|uniref:LURP-one-related/scramblase family protein n=1 Tax=Desemzia sp. RIT 804 TaxID=2810209 RepID=UPI00194E882A|nr:LURP-one-related family protein [Desemzia sp. RIT 804]MBM6615536.1 LURP-one-related family protein [Desemzia sp. RIT 804]